MPKPQKNERTASESLVFNKEYKGNISLIEINSETDFVAKNDDFIKFCKELSEINLFPKGNIENINNSKMKNGFTVKDS